MLRIIKARGKEEDAETPLGQAEGACIDRAIGPGKAELVQGVGEESHGLPPLQAKHEGDILKKQPARASTRTVEKAEDFPDQTGLASSNPCCLSRLTQILAREPRRDDVRFRKCSQSANVLPNRDTGKVSPENGASAWVDLAELDGLMASEV